MAKVSRTRTFLKFHKLWRSARTGEGVRGGEESARRGARKSSRERGCGTFGFQEARIPCALRRPTYLCVSTRLHKPWGATFSGVHQRIKHPHATALLCPSTPNVARPLRACSRLLTYSQARKTEYRTISLRANGSKQSRNFSGTSLSRESTF